MRYFSKAMLVASAALCLNLSAYSQDISLKINNATVKEAMERIKKDTGYSFVFSSKDVNTSQRVSVSVSDATIEEVIKQILKGQQGLDYVIQGKKIVLKRAEANPSSTSQGKKQISGNVVDSEGLPVIGASIVVKGTTNGVISDFDGNFTLNDVPNDAVIQFSFVGLEPQEVACNGKSILNVVMQSSSVLLDEVVAIGYEVKKKSVVTGAIGSLNSKEMLKARPANPVSALSGRVSGVFVSSGSGQPGTAPKLTIRGVGTNGNSNPLYIIDGLQMDDMNGVNPNDIESMEILKDATSTAIYGARGANGVVLITTKKGSKGKTTLSYDGYFGFSNVQKKVDMLNTDEYIMLMKEYYKNDNKPYPNYLPAENSGVNTNWLDEIFNTAPVTEHNVTANFGSEKGYSLFSLGYLDQNGIIGGDKSYFTRFSARMNSNYDITDYLTVGSNINFNYIDRNSVGTGTNGWNPLYYAMIMDPTTPVYDSENGDDLGYGVSKIPSTQMWNPLAYLDVNGHGINHSQHFYGNAYAIIKPIKGLEIRTDFGTNLKNTNQRSFKQIYQHNATRYNDKSETSQSSSFSSFWQWENTIRYFNTIKDHSFSVLLGTTASRSEGESLNGSRQNIPLEAVGNPNYWYINSGDVNTVVNGGTGNVRHSLFSVFGRVSYNYAEKYMGEFVLRRDGSSNFSPSNRYAVFPGLSLGWNVSNEKWWKVKNFDSLKLRLSWGQNGNESISPFSYTSIIGNQYFYTLGKPSTGTGPGVAVVGSAPNSLINPDVRWETSEQWNLGFDMAFFGSKLRGSIDLFDKRTKDLLFTPAIEDARGNNAPVRNVGAISNKGIELQLSYNDRLGDVDFSVSGNFSYIKNEVTEMGELDTFIEGGEWEREYITRMEVDHPIGYFYLFKQKGIFQNWDEINNYKYPDGTLIQPDAQPGDIIWQDTDGKDGITDADRVDCGSPWPKFTFGLNIAANYKGFDFNMLLSGKAGYKIYSTQEKLEIHGFGNLPTYYLERWQ